MRSLRSYAGREVKPIEKISTGNEVKDYSGTALGLNKCHNKRMDLIKKTQASDDHNYTKKFQSQTQELNFEGETELLVDPYLRDEAQAPEDPCLGGETQLFDDPCYGDETQLLDDPYFGGETQVIDNSCYRGETQVVDDPCNGDETQVVDDPCNGGETQIVDDPCNGGETQIVDDPCNGGETQVVDDTFYEGETQVIDDHQIEVLNDLDILDTQLIDNCDFKVVADSEGEETDTTEVLSEGEEPDRIEATSNTEGLFETDSIKIVDNRILHKEKHMYYSSPSKQEHAHAVTPLGQGITESKSGSLPSKFTSVRVASLRDSALAARKRDTVGTISQSSCLQNDTDPLKKPACENNELCHTPILVKAPNHNRSPHGYAECNEGRNMVGNSTAVRKLFRENSPQLSDHDNEFVRLSYVDSQEPGDLSQANALDFVDKFLQVNVLLEPDHEPYQHHICEGNLNPNSSAKGSHSLAKMVKLTTAYIESDIFDWDDCREDEGGGAFFSKKKEEIFNKKGRAMKSFTLTQNLKKKEERPNTSNKMMELAHSDSKLVLHKLKENEKKVESADLNLSRNLVNEFDDESLPYNQDVGIDTQIAIEAMEALCQGESCSNEDDNVTCNGIQNTMEGFEVYKRITRSNSKTLTGNLEKIKKASVKSTNNSSVSEKSYVKNSKSTKQIKKGVPKISCADRSHSDAKSHESILAKRKRTVDKSPTITPIIKRTRQSMRINELNTEEMNGSLKVASSRKMKKTYIDNSIRSAKSIADTKNASISELSYPKRKRSLRHFSDKVNGLDNIDNVDKMNVLNSSIDDRVTSVDFHTKKRTRSSLPRSIRDNYGKLVLQNSDKSGFENPILPSSKINENSSIGNLHAHEKTPENRKKQLDSLCKTPTNAASPVCMGNEYFKQSCKQSRTRSCLIKEFDSLIVPEPEYVSKESRKRRDMANVRALFSHHLNEDIIKQQKKILTRLGASVASSISEATHFITDNFVRTRNMLEAIACGKPVVTHLWLESCNETSCLIDEKNYILRDAKKEKEFEFCMPVSLARARQFPLLMNRRVFITPNTNPGKDIIASLVKAVHGQALERIGRSAMNGDKILDDLLILSCDDDYAICVPFLEKGASIYSSELLLNGIVTQKLNYERHRLFEDHVKRTRSTIWLRENGEKFRPVTRSK